MSATLYIYDSEGALVSQAVVPEGGSIHAPDVDDLSDLEGGPA